MTSDTELERASREFAEELTETVHAVAPNCEVFKALAVKGSPRFTVVQQPETGIPLFVNGEPLLSLKVSYWCTWDGENTFMAIDKSSIKVYAAASDGHPLFRYEYERNAHSKPAAHVHLHAHRDSFTYVMTKSGKETKLGERRANGKTIPTMQELHFPVGGHRFRPCLEDVLEMLINEFGVDDAAMSREALKQGRVKWRRTQTKSAVRDDPESAVATLRSLGYLVELQEGATPPKFREDRLSAQ